LPLKELLIKVPNKCSLILSIVFLFRTLIIRMYMFVVLVEISVRQMDLFRFLYYRQSHGITEPCLTLVET